MRREGADKTKGMCLAAAEETKTKGPAVFCRNFLARLPKKWTSIRYYVRGFCQNTVMWMGIHREQCDVLGRRAPLLVYTDSKIKDNCNKIRRYQLKFPMYPEYFCNKLGKKFTDPADAAVLKTEFASCLANEMVARTRHLYCQFHGWPSATPPKGAIYVANGQIRRNERRVTNWRASEATKLCQTHNINSLGTNTEDFCRAVC